MNATVRRWFAGAMRRLGSDYIVWDKAASIDFLRPGRGCVVARVHKTLYVRKKPVSAD